MTNHADDIERRAAAEFDRWALAGRGESMAEGHRDVVEQLLDGWTFGPTDHVLDVGCGNGWAVRQMLSRGAGAGAGVDLSPEMIVRARAASDGPSEFAVATATALPFGDGGFSHVLSVEALYYVPDPGAALAEWARVARPGARLGVMVELYAENPIGAVWQQALDVHANLLGADDYVALATAAGWRDVVARRVRERAPIEPEATFQPNRWWPSYEVYRSYREAGSLVFEGRR